MASNIDPEAMIGITEASRIIGIREDSLKGLADIGSIPCVRQDNEVTGRNCRMFRVADVLAYKEKRIAKLRERLTLALGA